MDTSDPAIQFDGEGHCNHCTRALARLARQVLAPPERATALEALAQKVKSQGKNKTYDCIIGVSGGVDSTTTAWHVKRLGLRPLAVHFDNGWDSELAVHNIKQTLDALQIDLYTYVVNWDEFRDLQLSFLKAGVPNAEAPTDHGITATLFRTARREGVRYILSGSNLVTESIMPLSWAYFNQDLKHLKALHRRFGTVPLESMPTISLGHYVYYVFIANIRQIPFLNYVDYDKAVAKKQLTESLGWRDYGGKHYESVWTRFYQGHYLVKRFGFDKRRAHLSSQICAGQITRSEGLAELEKPLYPPQLLREDKQFVLKKFGLSESQFEELLSAPARRHDEYPGHFLLFNGLRKYREAFRRFATTP